MTGERVPASKLMEVAESAARTAGERLQALQSAVEGEARVPSANVTREAAYESEDVLVRRIAAAYPEHSIVSEENPVREGDGRYRWLVDPLDGIDSYAGGDAHFAVTIAVFDEEGPLVGVVHAPELDAGRTYSAVRDGPARADGVEISTSERASLEGADVAAGYDVGGRFLRGIDVAATRRRRSSAPLNLCSVAAGDADAAWEADTYPWDVAAGVLVARRAGATVTDETGTPFENVAESTFDRRTMLATNGRLHEALLERVDETTVPRNRR